MSATLFSLPVVSSSLKPHGLQHTRLLCPSPSPGACWNSCRLSRWCQPTILSSVFPFSCFGSMNFIIHLQGPFLSGNHHIWGCRLSMLGNKAVSLLTEHCPIVYEYYFLYLNSSSWKMHKDLIKEFYICYFHFLLLLLFGVAAYLWKYQLLLFVCSPNGPHCAATLIGC